MHVLLHHIPHRVSGRGEECGAVARALHHEARSFSLPAVKEKVFFTTNERKQMSTKTTLKRIALVAVSALGFGLLNTVTASAAVSITPTAVSVGAVPTAQVGVVHTTPVTVTLPSATVQGDTFVINVRVTSAPTGSGFKNFTTPTNGGSGAYDETAGLVAGVTTSGTTVKAKLTIDLATSNDGILKGNRTSAVDGATVGANYTTSVATATANAAGNKTASFLVNVTPDIAGTYTVLVSTSSYTTAAYSAGTDGQRVIPYTAGDANASYSFSTSAAVASVTLAAVTGAAHGGASNGQIFSATIKDASGVAAQLATNETITLSSNSTTVNMGKARSSGTATSYTKVSGGTTLALSNADFNNGVAYFWATNSATTGTTAVITASGSGLLASSVTNTITLTTRTQSTTAATPTIGNPTGAVRPGSGKAALGGTSTARTNTSSTTAASHSYLVTYGTAGTVSTYVRMTVTDTTGDITGLTGAVYDQALTLDATDGTTASMSISGALSTAGDSFVATVYGASNATSASITVTSATAVATDLTSDIGTTITQSHGTSTVITAKLTDQVVTTVIA